MTVYVSEDEAEGEQNMSQTSVIIHVQFGVCPTQELEDPRSQTPNISPSTPKKDRRKLAHSFQSPAKKQKAVSFSSTAKQQLSRSNPTKQEATREEVIKNYQAYFFSGKRSRLELTAEQKKRIEENKQRAADLRAVHKLLDKLHAEQGIKHS